MDTQCSGLQLDHPVSRGHKYGSLIHQSGWREADYLTLENSSCPETARYVKINRRRGCQGWNQAVAPMMMMMIMMAAAAAATTTATMTTYRNFSSCFLSWFIRRQKRFGAHNLATLIPKSTYMQHTHRYSKAGCLLYNESTSSSHIHSFSPELFPLRAAVSLVSTKFSRDIFCLSSKLIASSLLFQPRRRLKGCELRVVRWLGARGFIRELKGFGVERRVNIIEPDRKIRCYSVAVLLQVQPWEEKLLYTCE